MRDRPIQLTCVLYLVIAVGVLVAAPKGPAEGPGHAIIEAASVGK